MTELGAEPFHSVAFGAPGNPSLVDAWPITSRRGATPAITLRTLGRSRHDVGGDPIAGAVMLLRRGEIVAIREPRGLYLACDATNAAAVARLRAKKRHRGKPFALMARDMAVIRRYCAVSGEEERELTSARAPIVLLTARPRGLLPSEIAPHLDTLGFMLPATALHDALSRGLHEPLVMTSYTVAGELRALDNDAADAALADIASHILTREHAVTGGAAKSLAGRGATSVTGRGLKAIAGRGARSVAGRGARSDAARGTRAIVRVMDNEPRLLRLDRGARAMIIDLPPGFEDASDILALGSDRRPVPCLIRNGQAIFSRPDEAARIEGGMTLAADLNRATPPIGKTGRPGQIADKRRNGPAGVWVQHHHAHIASCLCENSYPLDGPRGTRHRTRRSGLGHRWHILGR